MKKNAQLAQELAEVNRQVRIIQANRDRRQTVLEKPVTEEKELKRGFLERLKFWR